MSQLYDDAVKIGVYETRGTLKQEFNATIFESGRIFYNLKVMDSGRRIIDKLDKGGSVRDMWKNFKSTLDFLLVYHKAVGADGILPSLNVTINQDSVLLEQDRNASLKANLSALNEEYFHVNDLTEWEDHASRFDSLLKIFSTHSNDKPFKKLVISLLEKEQHFFLQYFAELKLIVDQFKLSASLANKMFPIIEHYTLNYRIGFLRDLNLFLGRTIADVTQY